MLPRGHRFFYLWRKQYTLAIFLSYFINFYSVSCVLLHLQGSSICCQVLVEVGDDVSLDANVFHIEGHARCRYGIDARSMVDEIRREGCLGNLFLGDVARQLIENCCHHFKVCELLCALRSIGNVPQRKFDAKY